MLIEQISCGADFMSIGPYETLKELRHKSMQLAVTKLLLMKLNLHEAVGWLMIHDMNCNFTDW